MSKNIIDLGVIAAAIAAYEGESFTAALGSTQEGYNRVMTEAVTPAIEAEVNLDKDTVCRSSVYRGVFERMEKLEDVSDADKMICIVILAEHYKDLVGKVAMKTLIQSTDPEDRMMGLLGVLLEDVLGQEDE